LKKILKSLLASVILVHLLQTTCQDPQNKEPKNSNVERLEKIFLKIPADKLLEYLITKEKSRLIAEMLLAQNPKTNLENPEDEIFEPKQPVPLSDEYKKTSIIERIKKKHIGELPKKVDDLIYFFSNHEECVKNNKTIYNRLLLHGDPGTGKSHLFQVLTEELEMPYLAFSASFFADKYIGEASRKIRKVFDNAKKLNKPVLIFIDEIDALAASRRSSTHNEHRNSLIQLLTEIQDLQNYKNVFIIVATNNLTVIDQAIKDRFAGSICEINELNLEERAELFSKIFSDRGITIEPKFAKRLAKVTDTKNSYKKTIFSNRDVENIVITSIFRQFKECKKDEKNCNKHLCYYASQAIKETNKEGTFASLYSSYCEGI